MSFTDNLLKQYADKKASKENYLNQFQGRQGTLEDTGFQGTAGTGIQMLNQGMANLLGAFNAGAVRANNNREELMKAEQLGYTRDQDAAQLDATLKEIALKEQDMKNDEAYRNKSLALQGRELEAKLARDRRQDALQNAQQQLVYDMNAATDFISSRVKDNKTQGAINLAALEKEGINLSVGEDGRYSTDTPLTDVQKGKLDLLNRAVSYDPTKDVAGVVETLKGRWGNKVSGSKLEDTLSTLGIQINSTLSPTAQARLTEYTKGSTQEAANRTKALLAKQGIREGDISYNFLNDPDLTSTDPNSPNVIEAALKGNPNLQVDAPKYYGQIVQDMNAIKKSPEYKAAKSEGKISDAVLEKYVASHVKNASSDSYWFFGDEINDGKLRSSIIKGIPDLIKLVEVKNDIKNINDDLAQNIRAQQARLNLTRGN